MDDKKPLYPQNIYLKGLIAVSPETVSSIADKLEVSRRTVSLTVNGHYKGDNIVPRILAQFSPEFLEEHKDLIAKH